MGSLWHLYNVHGNFEKLSDHSRVLLKRANLWNKYGKSGWGDEGQYAMFERNQAQHRSDYENKKTFSSKWSSHLTNLEAAKLLIQHERKPSPSSSSSSSDSVSTEEILKVADMLKKLKYAYRSDYTMFSQIQGTSNKRNSATWSRGISTGDDVSQNIWENQKTNEEGDGDPFNASLYFSGRGKSLIDGLPHNTHQGFEGRSGERKTLDIMQDEIKDKIGLTTTSSQIATNPPRRNNIKVQDIGIGSDTSTSSVIPTTDGVRSSNDITEDDDEAFLRIYENKPS